MLSRPPMILRLLSTALLLTAFASAAPAFAPAQLAAASSTADSSTLSLNSSLAAVCTPTECIQGANSLAAGVTVLTPVNATSRATVLLPGTYTSSSASTANSSLLTFGTASTFEVDAGFSTSGKLGTTFSVSLQTGLTTYSAPLFEGTAAYTSLANTSAINSTASADSIESFLLSDNVWAILQVGGSSGSRVVAWDGVADVGNMVGGSGGVLVVEIQGTGCTTPCASGGVCVANSTCACSSGFTGSTCSEFEPFPSRFGAELTFRLFADACAKGFFGKTCEACPVGCTTCDDAITGTGRCLDSTAANITLASACNCSNGVCASASTTATCACNAGWTTAANGTQCAACATGYYAAAGGDCLACDPSCASCSGSSGTCITCQSGLQPLSTDATKCTTATSATTNGTFVTCADRTYFDSTTSACVDCNPLCETCWTTGTSGCLSCRSPNALLNGECVALNSKTGVCDSSSVVQNGSTTAVGSNAGWVFDNSKSECDALPAKCTAGAIDNFSSTSTRSQLTCSACLAGSYLVDGACVSSCPTGYSVSDDGLSCVACDSSCSTCSGTTSSDCTTCSDTSKLVLNGTCITGPSCPTGYFAPSTNTTTCLACHPDCETCGGTFDTCLTCPSHRPVLSSASTCLLTCSSSEYYDTSKGACVACSSECSTCSGAGSDHCLSCSSTTTLKSGSCVATEDGCTVVSGFGVCLSALVTVAATSSSSAATAAKIKLPWYIILVIILIVLALLALGFYLFRRREQKRRREHTAKFADDLGRKEVATKLQTLDPRIAYPPLPRAAPSYDDLVQHEVPLTPRFVIANSPTESESTRWSRSSYGSRRPVAAAPEEPTRLVPQQTGASQYSQRSAFTTASGKRLEWATNNPFRQA
ncbi:insulin-like growth factor binding protein [Leucosporidium creatinivorum]|uniref:Insulin-like growth factor binding protein n=1 Tax=Leucosporidium creatinivorum TaxID=106004 RepID=A0A1Y2F449_9BASI|nr:insulin-like growth factor binding protein [Leucosporidium creatinivorum]